jgi:hypothetical protein
MPVRAEAIARRSFCVSGDDAVTILLELLQAPRDDDTGEVSDSLLSLRLPDPRGHNLTYY